MEKSSLCEPTHRRWSDGGGGSQWSKFVSTLNHLKRAEKPAVKRKGAHARQLQLLTPHMWDLEARCPRGLSDLWWLWPLPLVEPLPRCSTPLWWGGFLTDEWLRPESLLLPPASADNTQAEFHFLLRSTSPLCRLLTSRTSQLTGDAWSKRADTTFFHQFHQCSVPDESQKQTWRREEKNISVKLRGSIDLSGPRRWWFSQDSARSTGPHSPQM